MIPSPGFAFSVNVARLRGKDLKIIFACHGKVREYLVWSGKLGKDLKSQGKTRKYKSKINLRDCTEGLTDGQIKTSIPVGIWWQNDVV